MNNSIAEDWLSREDVVAREGRIARLEWMENQLPQCEYIGFQGGDIAHYLYEEARYCFAYGQFLATIVLGLAFIEQSLAGQFYATGRNDLKRANVSILFTEALNEGWITQTEFDNLEHARKVRNPITHFRELEKDDRIEMRSLVQHDYPYSILEADAYHVMETIFHLMGKNLLCYTV
jgi:hypothetical protein